MVAHDIGDNVSHHRNGQNDEPITLANLKTEYDIPEGEAVTLTLFVLNGETNHTLTLDSTLSPDSASAMHFSIPAEVQLFEAPSVCNDRDCVSLSWVSISCPCI